MIQTTAATDQVVKHASAGAPADTLVGPPNATTRAPHAALSNVNLGWAPGISETRVQPSGGPMVARRPSGDRPVAATNGKIEGQPRAPTAADSEQTLADADQTLSDADQTGSDRDQTSADCDQLVSDRDQAAGDRDFADGADAEQHDSSREIRQRSTRQRDQTSADRMDTANQRDASADARDVAALARDQAATARDAAMVRDGASEQFDGARMVTGAEIVVRAAEQRKRAAGHRAESTQQRELAAADREAAAVDREAGARERRRALVDREVFARALEASETDPLTGARTRAAGLADLDHELDRCRRVNSSLVVAYVDVVGLKVLNDSDGHAAGDELLKRVVALIGAHVRSYDPIIRLGGDEFLGVMSSMTLADARQRFSQVAGALAASPDAGAIRVGFAALTDEDRADELIARADSELLDRRHDWKRA